MTQLLFIFPVGSHTMSPIHHYSVVSNFCSFGITDLVPICKLSQTLGQRLHTSCSNRRPFFFFFSFCEKLKLDYNLSLHSRWEIALDQSMAFHKILLEQRHIQSTLVISNSKGLSEIFRDIRTSTYQICRIEKKLIRLTTLNKYMYNWTLEVRDILTILWKRGEIAP